MEPMTTVKEVEKVKYRVITVKGEKLIEMSSNGMVLVVAKKITVGNKVYKAPSNNG